MGNENFDISSEENSDVIGEMLKKDLWEGIDEDEERSRKNWDMA